MQSVGAPGAPGFGAAKCLGRAAGLAEGLERVAEAEVAGEERVRIRERSHAEVGRLPRADAQQRKECRLDLVTIGTRVEGKFSRGDLLSEAHERLGTRRRKGELAWIERGKCLDTGKGGRETPLGRGSGSPKTAARRPPIVRAPVR